MKITDRFSGDHKTFLKLFKDIDALAASPEPDAKRLLRLTELFVDHLLLHDWGERTFYYPAVGEKAKGHPVFSDVYLRLLGEEHSSLDELAARWEKEVSRSPHGPAWKVIYAAFKKGLLEHMDKEERELFPLSEKLLGAPRLHEISQELETRRKEAPVIRRHTTI